MKQFVRLCCLLSFCVTTPFASRAANEPSRREWTVDGVVREALVYSPSTAKIEPVPVVFAFHGHGGSMNNAARSFDYHYLWPEAIIVYMQGLATPGKLTDPEGNRRGWQQTVGDQRDRDLKFFDNVVASLKHDYRVDEKRLYATGHSNGGSFTYLLWAARGEQFAAFAPSAAIAPPDTVKLLKPKPVLHVSGENDQLVKFAWQRQMMDALRKLNQCGEGKPWEKQCTMYESKINAPVVTYIHRGTHAFPSDAPPLIVNFFKKHAQP